MRVAFVTLVAALLLLVTQSAAARSAALPNPCMLLTNADVAKSIGSKVALKSEQHFAGSRGRTCQWQSVNLAGPNQLEFRYRLILTVTVSTRAQFEKFARNTEGAIRVTGVGQIAFRQGDGNITELEVWQNGRSLSLIAGGVTAPLTAEKLAARAAVKRL